MKLLRILCLSGIMALETGVMTNTAYDKLKGPGLVALLGRNCPGSPELRKRLDENHIEYTMLYVEDNLDLQNYAVKYNKGRIPMLFENGNQIKDIGKYIRLHSFNK